MTLADTRERRECVICGADISAHHPRAKICGVACHKERTRRRVAASRAKERAARRCCETCGADITNKKSNARFCGSRCWWQHHYSIPENRERRLAYSRRHKAKNREHRREVARAYAARPEVRARRQAQRALRQSRRCEQCGKSILHRRSNTRFCSKECWKANYYQRPEVRERLKKARESPEARKWMRDYGQRPEVKARKRAAYRKRYARKKAEREAQKQAEGAMPGEA